MVKKIFTIFFGFFGYVSLAKLGLSFATINSSASPVWPATGFAIAFVLFFGIRFSGIIWLSAFAANLMNGSGIGSSFVIGFGNGMESFIAAILIKNIFPEVRFLETSLENLSREILRLIFSSLIGPICSALIGCLALIYFQDLETKNWSDLFLTWWLGDVLGALIFLPIIYWAMIQILVERKLTSLHRLHLGKIASVFLFSAFVVILVFFWAQGSALLYLLLPTVLLSFYVAGVSGIYLSVFLLTIGSVLGTSFGGGPFNWGNTNENLVALQVFLFSLGVTQVALAGFSKYLSHRNVIIILAIVWGISGSTFFMLERNKKLKDVEAENLLAEAAVKTIIDKMSDYEDALRGAVGLFSASDFVSRSEFKSYINSSGFFSRHPGLLGVGYISSVSKKELASFQKDLYKESPDFKIHDVPSDKNLHPVGQLNDEIHIIKYIEPLSVNRPAVGLVTSSEENRKLAALLSKSTGHVALTQDIMLVQDQQNKSGILMFFPHFKNEKLMGWVYAPIILKNLLQSLDSEISPELNFSFSSQHPETSASQIYYSSQREIPKYQRFGNKVEKSFDIYNRRFEMEFSRSSKFVSSKGDWMAWVGSLGALLALVCAWMYVNTLVYRDTAEKIIRDRTRELVEVAKMASLGQMASGLAHEINNPLTIIVGRSHLLKDKLMLLKPTPDRAIADLEKIGETANRIAGIIRGLKAFSRDSQQDPLIECSVSSIIQDTLSLCEEKFKHHSVKLSVEGDLGLKINARPSQIAQVILNLLNNAFDAVQSQDEKKISIKIEKVAPHQVAIIVQDNGPGVPEKYVEKIMEPFFTTKEVNKGTGLGLSISTGIIESHQGSLRYVRDSRLGLTQFKILLPLAV